MTVLPLDRPTDPGRTVARKLTAFTWGLFFIWIGAAFLADVGWPAGVLGAGVIALGVQAARSYLGLKVEVFGIGMGLAMLAWGAWHLWAPRFGFERIPGGLLPIVFIALGIALVLRALFRFDRTREER